jgi:hypothetical protein
MSLALVGDFLPDPLPRPSNQQHTCQGGGDMIVDLKDGHEIVYGPCRWPWQISELWGAMIQTADITEPGSGPDRARLAELEHVRQSLLSALQRHPIGSKQFAPIQISCGPSVASRDTPAPGYLCQTTMHSESGAS